MNTKDTIEYFGDRATLALALGITVQAIAQWPDSVPRSRRQSVREAMKARAIELEAKAKLLRKAAKVQAND